jgi:hypothetical protein
MGASPGDTRIDIPGMMGLPAESPVYEAASVIFVAGLKHMGKGGRDVHPVDD